MSIDVKFTVRYESPIETVFATATDVSRMDEWSAKAIRSISDGPVGVGTRFTLVTDFMGVEYPVNYTVTAYEPGRKFAYKSGGATPNEINMTFAPTDEGTALTFEVSVKVSGLLAPMVKNNIREKTQNNLIKLAEILPEED